MSRKARKAARRSWPLVLALAVAAMLVAVATAGATQTTPTGGPKGPKFSEAKAFDVSKPLKQLAKESKPSKVKPAAGPPGADRAPSIESGAAGAFRAPAAATFRPQGRTETAAIASPIRNFEGLSNLDNFNIFGFRANPPDPVGDVGPNHYVEMINLVFGVYDKQGNKLLGPVDTGTLWADFPIEDCTDPSGDPIVVYDQLVDRWLLSQFTTRGLAEQVPIYNCVAISKTGDPTGAYYRYAFITQPDTVDGGWFFPDYPKYSVWTDSYVLTTRDFGWVDRYGISVYALEKNKMLTGSPKARAVQWFLDSDEVDLSLIGDGLLPADIDGTRRPQAHVPVPVVGTMDDDYVYGAPFDALNVWEFDVQWNSRPDSTFRFVGSLPVNAFDSNFPCGPTRGCLPQPGISNTDQWLDVLSYRQRPTYRLAYRNVGKYEAMVTAQSVEASPGVAGMRWYEIRRTNGAYSVYQQGTYAPADGVNRWMGSIAMDKNGNAALGYSVVDGTGVYPGIRYTGRLAGDTLGTMGATLGEGVIINGTGVQTTTNSRWGDYTSMNVDPSDDCTFWYVNEYYQVSGLPLPLPPPPLPFPGTTAPWQTRIASFKLPGC